MRLLVGVSDGIGKALPMIGTLEERVFERSLRAHIRGYPVREKMVHPIFHEKEIKDPR